MICKAGDNIISSLGFTAAENFDAVKRGVSGVRRYEANAFGLPEPFMASLVDRERLNVEFAKILPEKLSGMPQEISPELSSKPSQASRYTDLEKAAILSVASANRQTRIDLSSERTLFILSTTKGNVDLLGRELHGQEPQGAELSGRGAPADKESVFLWHTARLVAGFFGNPNTPVVVSNACISGAAALIAAMRELQAGSCDHAVVVGVDFLSKFIVSGFQSFKALSGELCRPFDRERCGLNLGEAAATLILSNNPAPGDKRPAGGDGTRPAAGNGIRLVAGAIRNDANHISAPSRTGEGSFRALRAVLQNIDPEQIAFINAHGTATPYNDAMEAHAIIRAGLGDKPVNSLKAVFGHTLGAAGVLESIVSMRALEEGMVLGSMNFNGQDFERPINISRENGFSDKRYFVKMLSGFGGGNAALLFERN